MNSDPETPAGTGTVEVAQFRTGTDGNEAAARQLRDAFGTFATGVTIVTADCEGERLGSTISSFNSVSIDPPLVLFSIAYAARAFPTWGKVSAFAVNVLALTQRKLSAQFATPMTDKWAGVETIAGSATGAPLISGALASLECEVYRRYEGGDHEIILGRVLAVTRPVAGAKEPLLFYSGTYRKLYPETADHLSQEEIAWIHGW